MNSTPVTDISSLATTLSDVSIYLNIWFGSFLWLAGNINCFANMIVFRSRTFRHRSCFIYLFWESVSNFFFFNVVLVTRVLQRGFQIPIMSRYDGACKVREFLSEYIFQAANSFFVCATLDRLLSTQRSIALRQWSNRISLAYKVVLAFAVLWLLLLGHRLVLYTNASGSCEAQKGVYARIDTYLEACLSGVCTPLIVLVFAYLLLRSTRSVTRRRVTHGPDVASTANMSHLQRIEAQLTIMLFLQSIVAIIAFFPYAAQVLYVNITDGWEKSPERQAWEQLVIDTTRLCSYLFAATGFYISMISNRGYREQFMRMAGMERIFHRANLTAVTANAITVPSVPHN